MAEPEQDQRTEDEIDAEVDAIDEELDETPAEEGHLLPWLVPLVIIVGFVLVVLFVFL